MAMSQMTEKKDEKKSPAEIPRTSPLDDVKFKFKFMGVGVKDVIGSYKDLPNLLHKNYTHFSKRGNGLNGWEVDVRKIKFEFPWHVHGVLEYVVQTAVRNNLHAFHEFPDTDVVATACAKYNAPIHALSGEHITREIADLYLARDVCNLNYVPERFITQELLDRLIAEKGIGAVEYFSVPDRLRTYDIYLAAVTGMFIEISDVPEPMWDPKMWHAACCADYKMLKIIPKEHITQELIYRVLIRIDSHVCDLLDYIPDILCDLTVCEMLLKICICYKKTVGRKMVSDHDIDMIQRHMVRAEVECPIDQMERIKKNLAKKMRNGGCSNTYCRGDMLCLECTHVGNVAEISHMTKALMNGGPK